MVQNHFTATGLVFNEIGGIGWFSPIAVMELETFENVRKSVKKAVQHMEVKR